jgi:hypothetical protein
MAKRHAKLVSIPVSDVVAGDIVHAGEGDTFEVAGTRRNPVDGRVRLFDDRSTLRVELAPSDQIEVSRG